MNDSFCVCENRLIDMEVKGLSLVFRLLGHYGAKVISVKMLLALSLYTNSEVTKLTGNNITCLVL